MLENARRFKNVEQIINSLDVAELIIESLG